MTTWPDGIVGELTEDAQHCRMKGLDREAERLERGVAELTDLRAALAAEQEAKRELSTKLREAGAENCQLRKSHDRIVQDGMKQSELLAASEAERERLRGAVERSMQQANEYGPGEAGAVDCIHKMHATLRAALSSQGPVESEKLPCDVHLPPYTYIRKGCDLETLLVGIRARAKFPEEKTRFPVGESERDRAVVALQAVQDWIETATEVFGDPQGPAVLLSGYPKDEVDAALAPSAEAQAGQSQRDRAMEEAAQDLEDRADGLAAGACDSADELSRLTRANVLREAAAQVRALRSGAKG